MAGERSVPVRNIQPQIRRRSSCNLTGATAARSRPMAARDIRPNMCVQPVCLRHRSHKTIFVAVGLGRTGGCEVVFVKRSILFTLSGIELLLTGRQTVVGTEPAV
jgi:hypothetical protein